MMLPKHVLCFTHRISVMSKFISPGLFCPRQVGRAKFLSTKAEPVWINKDNVNGILQKYDNFLLDCDGVLWNADHFTKFSGTAKTMAMLKDLGKRFKFVTNNSIPTRDVFMEKFTNLGGFEANISDVYSVAYVAGLYLKNIAKVKGKCYMMGSLGMKDEFDNLGIQHIGHGPDLDTVSDHPIDLLDQHFEEEVEAVAVGFDIHFGYNKLFKAASYLSNPKCHYVATNDLEIHLMLDEKRRQPLTGVMVSALNVATNREPVVIGKPHKHLLECIQATDPGLNLSRTLMVGDSMKTDMAFANNSGIDSMLVLSGATSKEDFQSVDFNHQSLSKPSYVVESFANLHKMMS